MRGLLVDEISRDYHEVGGECIHLIDYSANAREPREAAQVHEMKQHWEGEKQAIDAIRSLKEELGQLGQQLERETDLAVAAEIRYGRMPELERRITEATHHLDELQAGHRMLKEEVDAEDIAEVVSKWTGVPVSRLMQGEMQKLVRLEEVLHERVVGQDEAVTAVANTNGTCRHFAI